MSDYDDYCDGSRAYSNNNDESPMLAQISYYRPRNRHFHNTPLQSEETSASNSEDVEPCLPPTPCLPSEDEMCTVHNPYQSQISFPTEVARYSQTHQDDEAGNQVSQEVPTLPTLGNWLNPKLLQNPQKPNREAEVLQEIMTEGLLKYGVPFGAGAVAGTFLMRRRYRQFKATPVESFLLSALHYYGALSLGLYTGLTVFTPRFETEIKERIPDSAIARALREKESQDRYK